MENRSLRATDPAGGAGLRQWFADAQQGDPVAMDGLLRALLPTARRFAAQSCLTHEDAEDAAQEALTALVRRVGALRAAEHLCCISSAKVVTAPSQLKVRVRLMRPATHSCPQPRRPA